MYTGRRLIGKTWYEFGSDGRLYPAAAGPHVRRRKRRSWSPSRLRAGQGRNYSKYHGRRLSQQDGQDDLVWYNATANGDGT